MVAAYNGSDIKDEENKNDETVNLLSHGVSILSAQVMIKVKESEELM